MTQNVRHALTQAEPSSLPARIEQHPVVVEVYSVQRDGGLRLWVTFDSGYVPREFADDYGLEFEKAYITARPRPRSPRELLRYLFRPKQVIEAVYTYPPDEDELDPTEVVGEYLKKRAAYQLLDEGDLTVIEIAEQTGLSPNMVQLLKQYGKGPSAWPPTGVEHVAGPEGPR